MREHRKITVEGERMHKQLGDLIDLLNHRMTQVEESFRLLKIDIKWMKRVGYYMAGVVSAIGFKFIL